MLQIQPSPNEIPLSIEALLELYTKLDLPKRAQIIQTFIIEESYTPIDNPLYAATIFSKKARQIITMLSYTLGYTTDEHVDGLCLLSYLFFDTTV